MAHATNGIDVLQAVAGKPIRFKINKRPSSNDGLVGIIHQAQATRITDLKTSDGSGSGTSM